MARTPLFPAAGNVNAWAQQFAMRTERDYNTVYPKTGTVSLSATVSNGVADVNMTSNSRVFLQPLTSQAAALSPYVSTKAAGQFVVTSTASVSCVFDYLITPPPL